MPLPDTDHDRIIYMRRALDTTCQILADEGFHPDEIMLTMLNFSAALMYKRIDVDFAIDALTQTIANLKADDKANKDHLH